MVRGNPVQFFKRRLTHLYQARSEKLGVDDPLPIPFKLCLRFNPIQQFLKCMDIRNFLMQFARKCRQRMNMGVYETGKHCLAFQIDFFRFGVG